jgi:hypothetical protein
MWASSTRAESTLNAEDRVATHEQGDKGGRKQVAVAAFSMAGSNMGYLPLLSG